MASRDFVSSSARLFDQNEDLEILQKRARQWIEFLLEEELPSSQQLPSLLANGEILARVGRMVAALHKQRVERPSDLTTPVKDNGVGAVPPPSPGMDGVGAASKQQGWVTKGLWDSIDNVNMFLQACREVGLQDVNLFSPPDVVEMKDIRRVCLCLRALAIRLSSLKVVTKDFDPVTPGGASPFSRSFSMGGRVESVIRKFGGESERRRGRWGALQEEEEDDDDDDDEGDEDDDEEYSEEEEEDEEEGYREHEEGRRGDKSGGRSREGDTNRLSIVGKMLPRSHTVAAGQAAAAGAGAAAAAHLAQEGETDRFDASAESPNLQSQRSSGSSGRSRTSSVGLRGGVSSSDGSGEGGGREEEGGEEREATHQRRGELEGKRVQQSREGREGVSGEEGISRGRRVVRRRRRRRVVRRQSQPPTLLFSGLLAAAFALVGGTLMFLMHRRKTYQIKKGDSLMAISKKLGKEHWQEIAELNPEISNPDLIFPDTVVRVD